LNAIRERGGGGVSYQIIEREVEVSNAGRLTKLMREVLPKIEKRRGYIK